MTDTEPFAHEAFYRSARPIRRFVAIVTAVALVILLVWWAGLANPRITVTPDEGVHELASGRGSLQVELRNDAPLAVELREVTLDVATVRSALLDGQPLGDRPELPGRSSAQLVIEYEGRGGCLPVDGAGASLGLEVETPLGLVRTVRSWLPPAGRC